MDRFPVSARFDEAHEGRILKWHEALDPGVTEEVCLATELVDIAPAHSNRTMTAIKGGGRHTPSNERHIPAFVSAF